MFQLFTAIYYLMLTAYLFDIIVDMSQKYFGWVKALKHMLVWGITDR